MSGRATCPLIGIALPSRATRGAALYARAVEVHGARVVELHPGDSPALDDLDGLLLSGGGDIDPRLYGQARHEKLGPVDRDRDCFELCLARRAVEQGVPVLGICRGAQVLGVALGGELVQDIPSLVGGSVVHSAGKDGARHWVRVESDSQLGEIMGARRVCVNSFHHQANGRLGPGVRATAWSEDRVIEAIEADGAAFALGVQWHPERMCLRAPRQARLFAAFVTAALERAQARANAD